jgi:pimeloyl-ACP methyl ester carboxylesterase
MSSLTLSSASLSSKKARTFVSNATIAAWTHPLVAQLLPGLVERRAVAAFATPMRTPRPAAPEVPGLAAHRFTVDTPAARLAVWDWGAAGPTVLLVHGWNGAAAQLAPFVAPLVRAGFTVAAFDQPGHGLSSGRRATVLTMRDAVRAAAAALGPLHAVVGHSLGATAAALAAADGLRLARLAMIAPPVEVEYYLRGFAARLGLSPARTDGVMARVRREVGGDLGRLDLRRQTVAAPALILHDPADREVPFADARAIAQAWPQATMVPVADVGHLRILESDAVIAQVVRFLAEPEAWLRSAQAILGLSWDWR